MLAATGGGQEVRDGGPEQPFDIVVGLTRGAGARRATVAAAATTEQHPAPCRRLEERIQL